jgi:small subunit ribosomal protein S4
MAAKRMKKCRRVGNDLDYFTVPAKQCLQRVEQRPGAHVEKPRKISQYGSQLLAKQTIRYYYNISEKMFYSAYLEADRKKGSTAQNLLQLLESRLDNVVFRMGFAATRAEARQLVSHRSICVNGKKVNIASYMVTPGDVVSVTEKAKQQERIVVALKIAEGREPSNWISINASEFSGTFDALPQSEELPSFFEVNKVVELYSK